MLTRLRGLVGCVNEEQDKDWSESREHSEVVRVTSILTPISCPTSLHSHAGEIRSAQIIVIYIIKDWKLSWGSRTRWRGQRTQKSSNYYFLGVNVILSNLPAAWLPSLSHISLDIVCTHITGCQQSRRNSRSSQSILSKYRRDIVNTRGFHSVFRWRW